MNNALNTNKNNNKVPIAIFICFSIAFILQGVLKFSGVFIFEKALDWEIFNIIDSNITLQIVYYTLMTSVCVYCVSFCLSSKPYSNKWYHSVIILAVCFINTYIKLKYTLTFKQHILLDVLLYIIVPIFINFTMPTENRLLKLNLFNGLLVITIQNGLYFCYLGLCYWSNLLNSLLPQIPTLLSASTNFLIRLEVYIGMVCLMMSINMLIKYIKEKEKKLMNIPMDIATDEAKEKELDRINEKKNG